MRRPPTRSPLRPVRGRKHPAWRWDGMRGRGLRPRWSGSELCDCHHTLIANWQPAPQARSAPRAGRSLESADRRRGARRHDFGCEQRHRVSRHPRRQATEPHPLDQVADSGFSAVSCQLLDGGRATGPWAPGGRYGIATPLEAHDFFRTAGFEPPPAVIDIGGPDTGERWSRVL